MNTFLLFTLKSSLCLSAGYFLYFLLLRHETFHRFKRLILLGIILISIIIPLVKVKVAPTILNSPMQMIESTITSQPPQVVSGQPSTVVPIQKPESRPVNILLFIYLAGAAVQLFLIFYSLGRIFLLLKRAKKINRNGIRLALVNEKVAPFCFGRRIVISEKDFINHGDQMIPHELTHMKEAHFLDLIVAGFYRMMTWYNPFSWLICRELKQNHEFEADRNVLRHGIDESDYQLLLVRTVAGEQRFHIANQFNQSNLKSRITMMNKTKSNPRTILKALLFLPLIAMMIQVFGQKQVAMTAVPVKDQTKKNYLRLTPDALKWIGLVSNPSGLFYKNTRFGLSDKGVLCLYFTKDVNNASIILKQGEKFPAQSAVEKILKNQTLTNNDFYPVVVAHYNGFRNQDMMAAEQDPRMMLLPIQVNMADLNIGKRNDTLVFWFKPTANLKKLLSPAGNTDEYLQSCPPDPNVPMKPKKH